MAVTKAKMAAQAANFQKFRPSPPADLIKKIVSYLNEKISTPFDTAVDVGCGTGKSTEALSPYFKNVIGFDSKDIRNNYTFRTEGLYNIIYRTGTPEGIGCLDSTVQLVTASQTAHWFNIHKFYSETERILTPGGTLAIYGYSLPIVKKPYNTANQIIQKFMFDTLAEFMPSQSKTLYIHKYDTQDFRSFLFNKESLIRNEDTFSKLKGTAFDLVNYIRNTSTVHNYEKIYGEKATNDLLLKFQKELIEAMGCIKNPEETEINIVFNFISILGRKPF